ncbi:MAG: DUF4124 domain-containing protein [Desulfosarcina sp.]|nr:DUF4124 domain-containing protein [Desulfobacterales bacterium]
MKSASLWLVGLALLLIAVMVHAGTVYYWTDENGVRHFSNTGIPDDVKEAGTKPEEISDPDAETQAEQNARSEQDEVLSGAPSQEKPTPTFSERVDQIKEDRLAKQAEQERNRLQDQIQLVENLSIGVSFTEGMKAARLQPLQEQLALLNSDPARYFRMKQEGAFKSTKEK